MIILYGIKTCDSVRKAIKFFNQHEIAFELVDFKTTPVDEEKITTWLEQTDMKMLFNARSTTYRDHNLKAMNLGDSEKLAWMTKENLLIKRPVIEFGDHLIVGFNETLYNDIFL
jgi:Spx/MgsR family transcriptional regulator